MYKQIQIIIGKIRKVLTKLDKVQVDLEFHEQKYKIYRKNQNFYDKIIFSKLYFASLV